MHINLILVFLFVFCNYTLSQNCGKDTLVSSTITAHDTTNSLCDVCLKYKFNGNSQDSNGRLSISCTLPGKLSCYENSVSTQYEINNNYHNCSIPAQTTFGDGLTTEEYLNTEYPIGNALVVCATDTDTCYVPTSGATTICISFMLTFGVLLINIIINV